ncbi:hypothetical protein MPH_14123 [Macrophomina phaseolina MS6]|uniref:Uncharacterized protein n=1 Tax=Macrophomina phaseolina (strain MS6) TaxID=1126212 RepID=K2RWW8_MACPH|nr:hypothetical protein MPH_14123 [Macrophomina phaseolina MS6]
MLPPIDQPRGYKSSPPAHFPPFLLFLHRSKEISRDSKQIKHQSTTKQQTISISTTSSTKQQQAHKQQSTMCCIFNLFKSSKSARGSTEPPRVVYQRAERDVAGVPQKVTERSPVTEESSDSGEEEQRSKSAPVGMIIDPWRNGEAYKQFLKDTNQWDRRGARRTRDFRKTTKW